MKLCVRVGGRACVLELKLLTIIAHIARSHKISKVNCHQFNPSMENHELNSIKSIIEANHILICGIHQSAFANGFRLCAVFV